jgi:hypothetical protein
MALVLVSTRRRPRRPPAELAASGAEPFTARVPGNGELTWSAQASCPTLFSARTCACCARSSRRVVDGARVRPPSSAASERLGEVSAAGYAGDVWVNGVEVGRAAYMLIEQRSMSAALAPARRTSSPCGWRRRSTPPGLSRRRRVMRGSFADVGRCLRKAAHLMGLGYQAARRVAGCWRSVWPESRLGHRR